MVIYYLGEHVMYQDETLICEDCGCEFVFTAGEQEFYAEKGLKNSKKSNDFSLLFGYNKAKESNRRTSF